MFSLFYGLFTYLFAKTEMKVLMLGIENSGKTTLLEKLRTLFTETRGLDPEKIIPTVGMNILKMEALQAKLVIWDLGGQGGLRSIWDKYFDETNALIWVVDASDRVRLRDSQETFRKMLTSDSLEDAPVLVLANKQDEPGAISQSEMEELFRPSTKGGPDRQLRVLGVCAKSGQNIRDGIMWLIEVMKKSPRTTTLRLKSQERIR